MTISRASLVLLLASSIAGCGSSPPRAATADVAPSASDVAGARPLEGPFASFEEVCGAVVREPDEDGDRRHERCTVRVLELADAGPFEAMATYYEGTAFDGNAFLGLKTARGWFVQEVPDGEPFGGGLSHHTPSSAHYDAGTTRFEDGTLRVVQRGSSSSFAPGRGNLGSSSRRWTSVQPCGLREGVVVCGALEQVWAEQCSVSDQPVAAEPSGAPGSLGRGERTCEEHGTDVH